jgi:hypothetical protein
MNFGGRPRRLELPSQMMHMNRDRIRFQFVIDAIEPFFVHRFRYHTTEAQLILGATRSGRRGSSNA